MNTVEKVINDLNKAKLILCNPQMLTPEMCVKIGQAINSAIDLLKEQESATVEPKQIELADETKAWLDTMDAADALSNIAIICIDWDGYRTANGLGELINEIWAYAQYCAKKLKEEQEPIAPKMLDTAIPIYWCGACGVAIDQGDIYCRKCGKPVKWE